MRILFIYPSWSNSFKTISYFVKKNSNYPPINLMILATIAKNKGHQVQVIDAEIERINILKYVKSSNPDLVCFTGTTPFFQQVVNLAKLIKDICACKIAIGGTHISILQEKVFEDCFDFAFIGESERIFAIFLDEKPKHRQIFEETQGYIENLDLIPFPDRNLTPHKLYYIGTTQGYKNFTTMMLTRGCPFDCIHCGTKIFGRKIRQRSIDNAMKEIEEIVNFYKIKHIVFLDDNFTIDKNYTLEFAKRIRKFNITFEASTRADLVDEEIISELSKSGLIKLIFGLETTNPITMKIMNKNVPLFHYETSAKICVKNGITPYINIMFGLPGETIESNYKTIHYVANNPNFQIVSCYIAVPYPGTKLREMAENNQYGLRLLQKDFSKYNRYENVTMESDKVKAEDLLEIHNNAYIKIYSKWFRIIPNFKRYGLPGLLMTYRRMMK